MRLSGALLIVFCTSALAELDSSDYSSGAATLDPEAARRLSDAIEIERREEARRAMEREANAAREQARIAIERLARPYPERLVVDRCHRCHAAASLGEIGHTRPGWLLTILRMRWLNGAEIGIHEAWVIAEHLAARQPARGWHEFLEYLSMAVLPALIFLGASVWHRLRH